MPPDLPAGYHLRNFEFLIGFVRAEYADLLTPEECLFADRFEQLSREARSLWVRMATRRGPWFRADRLDYVDVPDTEAALLQLSLADFVSHAGAASAEALLDLFTRPELEQGSVAVRSKRVRSKPELVNLLGEAGLTPAGLGLVTPLIGCRQLHHVQVFRLLFFGNLRQDLTDFVLHELGIMRYEDYALTGRGYFSSRAVVDDLLTVEVWSRRVRGALERAEANELADLGDALWRWDCVPEARARRDHLLLRVARDLERLSAPQAALTLYRHTNRVPARERRARVLHTLGRRAEMVSVCQSILNAPDSEAEAVFAARFSTRVLRGPVRDLFEAALLRCAAPLVRRYRRPHDSRRLELPNSGTRVEECVRSWYEAQGDRAFFVENGLLPGLFGLIFWDIVFAELPGVFFHPFQNAPADMYQQGFRERRRALIDARICELETGDGWKDRARYHYESRKGIVFPFVHWRALPPELFRLALERIPGKQLARVSERILDDPRSHRSGFPDLVVFPDSGGYRLVEVKGPGDALQDNQKHWMQAFADWEIPATVVDVSWQS